MVSDRPVDDVRGARWRTHCPWSVVVNRYSSMRSFAITSLLPLARGLPRRDTQRSRVQRSTRSDMSGDLVLAKVQPTEPPAAREA